METSPLNSNNCTTINTVQQQKQNKTLKKLVNTLDKTMHVNVTNMHTQRQIERDRPQTEEDPKEREGDREERVGEENKKGRERGGMWELLGVLIREKDKKKERNKSNGRLPPPLTFHLFFHKSNNDSCYLSFEATILATFLSLSLRLSHTSFLSFLGISGPRGNI